MPNPIIALALLASAANPSGEVDKVIRDEMKLRNISGMSLIITIDDKVVKRSVYGLNDLEQKQRVNKDHVFETGSIAKTFCATIILQLMEEGKLKLSDKLGDRLPSCPGNWREITLDQMLHQTAGLQEYALIPEFGMAGDFEFKDLQDGLGKLPLDFPSGSIFSYSNSNYLYLGLVAEKIEGKDYSELVQKRIFDRAGMKRSYVADQYRIIPNRARGYINLGKELANQEFVRPGQGDSGFMNHPEDLIAFERAIREHKLLKGETVEMMQTSGFTAKGRKTGYGMGWFTRKVNGLQVTSHGGNTGGFLASMTRVPSGNMTIVLNGNVHDYPGDPIALLVAEKYVPGLKYKAPVMPSADPDLALNAKLIKILQNLSKGQILAEDVDSEMLMRLGTSRAKMGLPGLAKFRDLKTMSFIEKELVAPDTIYRYRAVIDKKPHILSFTVSTEGKLYAFAGMPE